MTKAEKNSLRIVVVLLYLTTGGSLFAQEKDSGERYGYTTERQAREDAIKVVLPEYPQDALERGIAGIVKVVLKMTYDGEVVGVRVQPGTDPALRKALGEAVREWKFKPVPEHLSYLKQIPNSYRLRRLTFEFVIEDGKGRAALYVPPDGNLGRLGGGSTADIRDWKQWEDALDSNQPASPLPLPGNF
jgi:TonB family protein